MNLELFLHLKTITGIKYNPLPANISVIIEVIYVEAKSHKFIICSYIQRKYFPESHTFHYDFIWRLPLPLIKTLNPTTHSSWSISSVEFLLKYLNILSMITSSEIRKFSWRNCRNFLRSNFALILWDFLDKIMLIN